MAVPFNLPEDHNEVEVIITQLQYLLTKLQTALRRSQNPLSSHASTSRVRTNSSNRSRVREESSTSSTTSSSSSSSSSTTSSVPSANLPEILNTLAWLAAASQEDSDSSSQQTTRPTRSRTSSESSCCEESKISETTALSHGNVQDWNQETDNENEETAETKSYSREGILSKIVPGPVSAPLWTAMICFVGWHIFRAR